MSAEKFAEIAQESIQTAEQVKCGLPDFHTGLQTMIDELEERRQQVGQELKENERRALLASED